MDDLIIEEEQSPSETIQQFGRLGRTLHKGHLNHPNQLSEELVHCMKDIFITLADCSSLPSRFSLTRSFCSSISPRGYIPTFWPLSEFMISSWRQSPQMDIQCNNVLSTDSIFDPYKALGKLSWTDIGNYKLAKEVSWMSVEKKQLKYVSDSLKKFRLHIQLEVTFSAACIEYVVLKMKPPVHRPQTALLLALRKLKVSEEQKRSSIGTYEPLVIFALSCGAFSSPAVRAYPAARVREELEEAQGDFIRASVGMSSKRKLLVPKMSTLLLVVSLTTPICQFGSPTSCLNRKHNL